KTIPGILTLEQEHLSSNFQLDPTRLTLLLQGLKLSGFAADTILREQYNVTVELPMEKSLTCMISIGNTQTDLEQLVRAIAQLAEDYAQMESDFTPVLPYIAPILLPDITPRDAFFAPTQIQALAESVGEVSAELICPYPPGIPVLIPGERITTEAIAYLQQVTQNGAMITGCQDTSLETIAIVVRDK
ncbi:arginine/lysine/ornithine decarboxylase, partial [Gloeocapsa sp. PCC 73106]